MPRKPKDPTKTARDGTARGRPGKVGRGKASNKGKTGVVPAMTPLHWAFVECWMVRRNATRAYQDSHPNCLSYETARSEGSRLFRDPRISNQIRALLKEELKRLESTPQKVTDALAARAFSSISDVYSKDGMIIAPADLPRGVALAVKKIKRREIMGMVIGGDGETGKREVIGHTVEVEMHDALGPLRLLGLEHGMFTEKVEHTADDAILAAIKAGRERALAGE